MNTLIIEPFNTGSHKNWLNLLWSEFENVDRLTLPGRHWKWRLNGSGIQLAQDYKKLDKKYDRIIATSFLDLTTFVAHANINTDEVELFYYFHENQFTYPTSNFDYEKKVKRDKQYGFIQMNSALLADKIFFNTEFNRSSFLEACESFMKRIPDYKITGIKDILQSKSEVLSVPHDFKKLDQYTTEKNEILTIVWGHRLEWDKCPEFFVDYIKELINKGTNFQIYLHGDKNTEDYINGELGFAKDYITSHGYIEIEEYYKNLYRAHICFSSAIHEFQGLFMQEAIYCGCMPLAPNQVVYPEYIPEKYLFKNLKEALLKTDLYNSYKGELKEEMIKRYSLDSLRENYKVFIGQ